jgi:hypothetical protein
MGTHGAGPKNPVRRGRPWGRPWRTGGVTRAHHAVAAKTEALTAVEPIVPLLVLAGRRGTLDALLPQRPLAPTLVDQGGAEGMSVKAPQPQLRAASARVVPRPPVGAPHATPRPVDLGPGRSAQRQRTTRAALVGARAGPGLAQVLARGRHGRGSKTGQARVAVVSGGTRWRPAHAPPRALPRLGTRAVAE